MADPVVREDKYGTRWILRLSDRADGTETWRAYQAGDDEQDYGYIQLHFDATQRRAEIWNVRVNDQSRRRGVGSLLVEHAIAECRRRGYNELTGVIIDRENLCGLRDFYEKLGFSFTRSEPDDISRAGTIRKVIQ